MSATLKLEEVARRVNWYTPPERLLANTNLFLCHVMARGLSNEIVSTQRQFSLEKFREAYLGAPPGLFTKRAWAYWGLVLFNNTELAMPERFAGANRFDWRKST